MHLPYASSSGRRVHGELSPPAHAPRTPREHEAVMRLRRGERLGERGLVSGDGETEGASSMRADAHERMLTPTTRPLYDFITTTTRTAQCHLASPDHRSRTSAAVSDNVRPSSRRGHPCAPRRCYSWPSPARVPRCKPKHALVATPALVVCSSRLQRLHLRRRHMHACGSSSPSSQWALHFATTCSYY